MIAEQLKQGAQNPTTGRELCERLHISRQELSRRVELERRAGAPICSQTGEDPGYFLAHTRLEMFIFCKSLRHREQEIATTRRACQKTMMKFPIIEEEKK